MWLLFNGTYYPSLDLTRGQFEGVGKLHLETAVDTYGSWAFRYSPTKARGSVPRSQSRQAVRVTFGDGYQGAKVNCPRTNSFAKLFRRTVLDDFRRLMLRTASRENLVALQKELNDWLAYYNRERPHLGSQNLSCRLFSL